MVDVDDVGAALMHQSAVAALSYQACWKAIIFDGCTQALMLMDRLHPATAPHPIAVHHQPPHCYTKQLISFISSIVVASLHWLQ